MTLGRDVPKLLATGRISQADADAVSNFAAFLRDAGASRDEAGRGSPIATWVMWKHRAQLRMSDDDVREIAGRRGEPDPSAAQPCGLLKAHQWHRWQLLVDDHQAVPREQWDRWCDGSSSASPEWAAAHRDTPTEDPHA